jgi:hypothetical protein
MPACEPACPMRRRKFAKIVTRGTTLTTKDVDFTAKVGAAFLCEAGCLT